MFNGKIHYKWAIFNSFLYVYQRVKWGRTPFFRLHQATGAGSSPTISPAKSSRLPSPSALRHGWHQTTPPRTATRLEGVGLSEKTIILGTGCIWIICLWKKSIIYEKKTLSMYIPADPNTFLGSVWGMIWGVFCTFSGGVWIHRVWFYILCPEKLHIDWIDFANLSTVWPLRFWDSDWNQNHMISTATSQSQWLENPQIWNMFPLNGYGSKLGTPKLWMG